MKTRKTMAMFLTGLCVAAFSYGQEYPSYSNDNMAKYLQVDVNAGIAKVTRNTDNRWNMGFTIGAEGFLLANPAAQIGARVNYYRMGPRREHWTTAIDSLINSSVSGSMNLWEIAPALRLTSPYTNSWINFFGQVSSGILIRQSKVDVSGTIIGIPVDRTPENLTEERFILSLGAGVLLGYVSGISVEIFPEYHMAFPLNSAVSFYSITIGPVLRF